MAVPILFLTDNKFLIKLVTKRSAKNYKGTFKTKE